MSIETWKAEFYPIAAEHTNKGGAIDHSLQKWLGLRPENLAKHEVELFEGMVIELGDADCINAVVIDGGSCSLCHHYLDHDWDENDHETACYDCPLCKVRGGQCDDEIEEEWENDKLAPWQAFTRDEDREPMIIWLTKTKEANKCQP